MYEGIREISCQTAQSKETSRNTFAMGFTVITFVGKEQGARRDTMTPIRGDGRGTSSRQAASSTCSFHPIPCFSKTIPDSAQVT
jgi:hypothetical protein